jgi:ribosomal protein L29
MDIATLRQKSLTELQTLLREQYAEVNRLRLLVGKDQAKNLKDLHTAKKTIARIQTLISANA